MTYNIPRMTEVYNLIITNPKLHNQKSFETLAADTAESLDIPVEECQTTCCIAGWAIMLNSPEARNLGDAAYQYMLRVGHNTDAKNPEDYQSMGAELLGIPFDESTQLFYNMSNEAAIVDLKYMIDNGEAPPRWDEDDDDYYEDAFGDYPDEYEEDEYTE